jgi:hypothetical protein
MRQGTDSFSVAWEHSAQEFGANAGLLGYNYSNAVDCLPKHLFHIQLQR